MAVGSYRDRGRTHKLFLCCLRPCVDAMDDSYHRGASAGAGDPVFAYISVSERQGTVLPTILSTFSKERGGGGDGVRRRKMFSRSFSRTVKALLSETSLAKKIRSRRKNARRSNSTLSSKIDRILNSAENAKNPRSANSTLIVSPPPYKHSSSYSSAMASSLNPTPPSEPTKSSTNCTRIRKKGGQEGKEMVDCNCSNSIGPYLFLVVVLLVLVCCGKLCAIIFTSTCLIAVPRRPRRRTSRTMDGELPPAVDSVEHKKRVILEGLLERKR